MTSSLLPDSETIPNAPPEQSINSDLHDYFFTGDFTNNPYQLEMPFGSVCSPPCPTPCFRNDQIPKFDDFMCPQDLPGRAGYDDFEADDDLFLSELNEDTHALAENVCQQTCSTLDEHSSIIAYCCNSPDCATSLEIDEDEPCEECCGIDECEQDDHHAELGATEVNAPIHKQLNHQASDDDVNPRRMSDAVTETRSVDDHEASQDCGGYSDIHDDHLFDSQGTTVPKQPAEVSITQVMPKNSRKSADITTSSQPDSMRRPPKKRSKIASAHPPSDSGSRQIKMYLCRYPWKLDKKSEQNCRHESKDQSNRAHHEQIHWHQAPYVCPYPNCGKRVNRSDDVRRHVVRFCKEHEKACEGRHERNDKGDYPPPPNWKTHCEKEFRRIKSIEQAYYKQDKERWIADGNPEPPGERWARVDANGNVVGVDHLEMDTPVLV